jgi:hypothetical protein
MLYKADVEEMLEIILYRYIKFKLWVRKFAYSSRRDVPFGPKRGMLMPCNQHKIL